MPPKKREKEGETSKNGRIELNHLQADHELFLQAFEKPTQIYRFLRTRNMLKPIFLNRNLSYMKQRMSRTNKNRADFKVDSVLDRVKARARSETQPHCMGDYMTLTFLGFYDKNLGDSQEYQVKAEALLLKLCHKKRKDSSSAVVEVSVGCCSVPLNPSPTEPPAMASALSISSEAFSPSHGPEVKSYVLMLRVSVTQHHRNNNQIRNTPDDSEPAHKRLKTSDGSHRVLGSELVVYDKHNRCLLRSGEYDLVLRDALPPARSPHKGLPTHWETLSEDMDFSADSNPFDVFKLKPTLKLKLSWSQEPTNGLVNRPKPYSASSEEGDETKTESNSNKENNKPASNCTRINNILNKNNTDTAVAKTNGHTAGDGKPESSSSLQIIYQFLYNNNSRQQTEACEDLHCPWCSLDCGRLYSLLKHLKLCHSRFSFTYFPIPNGARIDVSINESYDGSYAGAPHAACAGPARTGPGRRAPLTHVLVARGRRIPRTQPSSLTEFLQADDAEMMPDGQRPYITGHNRLYHHTITCLPVYPKELEVDSEEETDPLWLQQKTMMMIDEFTDVNEGEKELMKMWNLHVMKYNFVGDCQIPIACQMFLQTRGKELLEKNLYRNFVLHMCSLHDFGLITPIVVYQTIQMLNQILAENNDCKYKIRNHILLQREHWKSVGMHQQPSVVDQKSTQTLSKPLSFNSFNGESSPAVRRKTSTMQSSNRMASSSYIQHSTTSGSEAKKKPENAPPAANCSVDTPLRRKSVQAPAASASSVQSKNATVTSPLMPLRRKSAGSNILAAASHTRKRLSLQERKNST